MIYQLSHKSYKHLNSIMRMRENLIRKDKYLKCNRYENIKINECLTFLSVFLRPPSTHMDSCLKEKILKVDTP